MLADGTLPDGYTVRHLRLVKVGKDHARDSVVTGSTKSKATAKAKDKAKTKTKTKAKTKDKDRSRAAKGATSRGSKRTK